MILGVSLVVWKDWPETFIRDFGVLEVRIRFLFGEVSVPAVISFRYPFIISVTISTHFPLS